MSVCQHRFTSGGNTLFIVRISKKIMKTRTMTLIFVNKKILLQRFFGWKIRGPWKGEKKRKYPHSQVYISFSMSLRRRLATVSLNPFFFIPSLSTLRSTPRPPPSHLSTLFRLLVFFVVYFIGGESSPRRIFSYRVESTLSRLLIKQSLLLPPSTRGDKWNIGLGIILFAQGNERWDTFFFGRRVFQS